jgi:hypothetical protein
VDRTVNSAAPTASTANAIRRMKLSPILCTEPKDASLGACASRLLTSARTN